MGKEQKMTTETRAPGTADTTLEGFDTFAEATLKDWTVPGAAVVVVKDGEVVLSRGYGLRDVAQGLEVTPRTIFAIGSSTKAFTTMTLALLVDEGTLDWDTPIRQYLPTFTLYDTFATARMTARDLVTHRSGLPRHDLMWYNTPFSRKDVFDRLQYLRPNKDFRTTWQYQNLMYMTAGYLVEALTSRSWEEFVIERIFQPLGMERSNLSVDVSRQSSDIALPYKEKDEDGDGPGAPEEISFRNLDTVGPAGSINSSVEDMARWLLLHLEGGKHGDRQIVSEHGIEQMHTPQMVMMDGIGIPTRYPEAPQASYGMGWFVQPYRGHNLIHHGGNVDGFSALVSFLPREKMGVVVLTNGNGNPVPYILSLNIYDRLLGLDQAPWNSRYNEDRARGKEAVKAGKEKNTADRKEGKGPSHDLDEYAGEYEHPGYGVMSIATDGDGLTATYNGLDFKMTHYHYDVFELTYEIFDVRMKVVFSTNAKGDVASLALPLEPSAPDIEFTRLPSKDLLDKATLERFTGAYELMGRTLSVALKGEDTLLVSIPGQPDYELTPYKGTQFEVKGLSGISFEFKDDEVVVNQMGAVFTAQRKR